MYSELPYAKYTNLPYPGERDQFKIDSWSPKKKKFACPLFYDTLVLVGPFD